MAVQVMLRFGTLTLCNPSNGVDGYERVRRNNSRADYSEVTIPGAAGRVKAIMGRGQTDQSSLKLEFVCDTRFDSESAREAWYESVETAAAATTNNLRTVTYGSQDGGNTHSEADMDMEFLLGEEWKAADGYYWCTFTATFAKFSG